MKKKNKDKQIQNFFKSLSTLGFAVYCEVLFPLRETMSTFIDFQLSMAMGFGLNISTLFLL